MQRTHSEVDDSLIKRNEKEIESLRLRLSERVSDKIKTGNPSIADLSDANRPTKLADQFGELYDNEWTNTLEELQSRFQSEKDSIEYLTKVLRNTSIMVGQTAGQQLNQIIRQTHALIIKSSDRETILQSYKERVLLKTVEVFIRKSIHIMWFMYVSHPPLCLQWTESGDKVDYDSLKEYTKRGSHVDFCVWPAVKLHKTGPLLRKGVVQPK